MNKELQNPEIEQDFKIAFDTLEKSIDANESSELHLKRKAAFDAFLKLAIPHAKNEEYKYTNFRKALAKDFSLQKLSSKSDKFEKSDLDQFPCQTFDAYKVVLVNGVLRTDLSSLPENDNAITIKGVKASGEQVFSTLLDENIISEPDAFVALNTAFLQDGVIVEVAKNQQIGKPVVIYRINTGDFEGLLTTRSLVKLEESASLDVIEFTVNTKGNDRKTFQNHLTEVRVAANAQLSYYKVQDEGEASHLVDNTEVVQYRDSVASIYTFTLGGKLVRNNLNISLEEEHIQTNMYGLYPVKDKQHVDNHTTVDHKKAHCESNELYKGIMADKATAIFNGKIYVRPQAQKTNAFQSNNNIVLSDHATINTKPQLEIWADDVKCSHGATTSSVDPEQMFYLQARGVGKSSAQRILLRAFAAEIFEKVKFEELREYLGKKMDTLIG
ncbi:MAG: Fe-S cluster assembly protein SufD [Cyclobacteriaceae bacterium]|nr:Fe-S cluster assembly protein SufD [Cyclobacteriaceae bacterium]MCH8515835.1 Fe-S cluster assembly protein SufD [Cyclobacteriaceae bacterium]